MATAVSFGLIIIGSVIWSIRLEGRVNVIDTKREDLKELLLAQFGTIDSRLSRIERALNGAWRNTE